MKAHDAVTWNELRWDGRTRGHFETYEMCVLDPGKKQGWWLRYTLDSPLTGATSTALWGAHFADEPRQRFALKMDFPGDAFATQSDGFHIRVSRAELSLDNSRGGLRNPKLEGQALRWNLHLADLHPSFSLFPKQKLYDGPKPEMKVAVPVPLARVGGVVEAGEERTVVKSGRAQQLHTWGTRRFDSWALGFATLFREQPNAYVYALGALPHAGGRGLTTVHVREPGGRLLSFFEGRQRFDAGPGNQPGVWSFDLTRGRWAVTGRFSSSLQKMAGVALDDPDGTRRYCHHAGLGDATLEVWHRLFGRRQLVQTLTAKGTAVFQQGSPIPFEEVEFFL